MKNMLFVVFAVVLNSAIGFAVTYKDPANRVCDSSYKDNLYQSTKNNSGVLQKTRIYLYNGEVGMGSNGGDPTADVYVICSGNTTLLLSDDLNEALTLLKVLKSAGAIKTAVPVSSTSTCTRQRKNHIGKWKNDGKEMFAGNVPDISGDTRYIDCQTN